MNWETVHKLLDKLDSGVFNEPCQGFLNRSMTVYIVL